MTVVATYFHNRFQLIKSIIPGKLRYIHHISSLSIMFELNQLCFICPFMLKPLWSHMRTWNSVQCLWCLVQSIVNLRIHEKTLLRCSYVVLPHKGFTVPQPSHLIKVINLQQLAQKINNWFRCKVPPPSYAACIFILTVNKIGSSANLWRKYAVAHPEMTCFQLCALSSS